MKILIIHTYGMGDMIMFTPALKKIKDKYPNSKIDFLVFQKFATNPIKNCDYINNIYISSFKLNDLIKNIFLLRENKYDLSIVTSGTNSLKGGIFSFLLGAKNRVGEYIKFKNILYTQPVKYLEKLHRVENNLSLIDKNNIKENYPFLCNVIRSTSDNDKIKIGFHIGSNKQFSKKRWEKEKFIDLVNKLNKNFNNIEIVIFSGPDEEDESKELVANTHSKLLLNLDFDNLSIEISKCNIFINTDSGLGHIASCFNDIEIFTIFGPAKDYKAKPYSKNTYIIKLWLDCQPCYGTDKFQQCKSLECLKDLSVDFVFNYIVKNSKVLKEK